MFFLSEFILFSVVYWIFVYYLYFNNNEWILMRLKYFKLIAIKKEMLVVRNTLF